jgi:hypothetical protein
MRVPLADLPAHIAYALYEIGRVEYQMCGSHFKGVEV